MNLSKIFSQFIQKEGLSKVLLGLSGGPDSTALFHILVESKLPFAAAYVNHGWRAESAEEEALLCSKCAEHTIPFFSVNLSQTTSENNLEERARKKRLEYFKAVCKEEGFEGVMLGHHANDQAETVLKRLLEGASLRKLKALEPKMIYEELVIYRPFLNVRKKELLNWLEERNISYFIDSTNTDPKFLRSRMRGDLIPLLSAHFGKEVDSSLCRIGELSKELNQFLEHVLSPYRKMVQVVENGACLNFISKKPETLFEWKLVLRDFFENQHCILSDFLIEQIADHLMRCPNKEVAIRIKNGQVKIERFHLKYLPLEESANDYCLRN